MRLWLFLNVIFDNEEFIEGIFWGDVLFLDSEDHPNASTSDFDWRYNHDNNVGFHGDTPEDIGGYIEHPYEPEYEIEEDDCVVEIFISVDECFSEISMFWF